MTNSQPGAQPLSAHFSSDVEQQHYARWLAAGLFDADPNASGPAYSVVIPPPNVTGQLHMGHALNNTLQDILVRYKRMDGFNVVWIPGVDHASIAVHWLLDKALAKEGTDRFALGREAFLERAWAFKRQVEGDITAQQRRLGISCDWQRLRFTLDEGLSAAVNEIFVRLYEDGLIYRAEQLVNWDPVSQTTLSDLEVVYEENVAVNLVSFAYPLTSGAGEIVVATTRPETIPGDTAVAVHPEDPRYKHLIGQTVTHPLNQRTLPIIGDAQLVDPAFGTGAVKITPAHDFNDFAVGQRHQLPLINILQKDGRLNAQAGAYAGLTTAEARAQICADLDKLKLLRGEIPHKMNRGRSERSGAVVEPFLSTQWYVRTKPLARAAMAAVTYDKTRFVPRQWENTYFAWLRDIRDWCISRQLWWGHRIPAWYCQACEHLHVQRSSPQECARCGHEALFQDEDILDTWFSSGLWPFSTMGWPEKSAEMQRWYPTAVLITGFDIIFFWVARMMMLGIYATGVAPFADIYLHALIRDKNGEKMSKTKGNVVNPLAMIDSYGCDAFRFTLASMAIPGRDVRWDEGRAAGYQRFVNKIWQAARFLQQVAPTQPDMRKAAPPQLADAWILARLRQTVAAVRQALDTYRFDEASLQLYHFFWDDYCDWYLEISKALLRDPQGDKAAQIRTQGTLRSVFSAFLRLLSPIMPFVSETLWETFKDPALADKAFIGQCPFPQVADYPQDEAALASMALAQQVVSAVRRVRTEYTLSPSTPLQAHLQVPPNLEAQLAATAQDQALALLANGALVAHLCNAQLQQLPPGASEPRQSVVARVGQLMLFVPLMGLIDVASEQARIRQQAEKLGKQIAQLQGQLGNDNFVARAPAEVVEEKRALLASSSAKLSALQEALTRLA